LSNFTVSARKYRPGVFETVVGQDHVTQTLKNAIKKDHLGQAFLFCGPRGVGKTTCARILAKALNCENLSDEGEPCGICPSCLAFAHQQSFNIYELDAASNNSVEDIRNLVEQVRFAPQQGKYKIYIIDEVHMLSTAAFNAFLKTLEEPPPYAIFILATTEKHKILPTILSRCQLFEFHRIGVKQIMGNLKDICEKEGIKAEDQALHVIAQKADGALRDALSIFDRLISSSGDTLTYKDVIENLNLLDYEYYFKITDLVLNQELSETLLLFEEILTKGFDAHNFLNGLNEHIRNLLVGKDLNTLRLMEVSDEAMKHYAEQSKNSSMSFLLSAMNLLNQFDVNFKASKNGRLHIELALMKLCHLQNAVSLSTNGQQPIEKKKPSPTEPVKTVTPVPTQPQNSIASRVSEPVPKSGGFSMNMDKIKVEALSKQPVTSNFKEKELASDSTHKVEPGIFEQAWKGYALNLRERGKTSVAPMVDKYIPLFPEDGSVKILVENESVKNLFNEDRMLFNEYLNRDFQISNIKIVYEVKAPTEEEVKRYLTSDREIFNRMYEKNPAVKDLQERLGLKVD
jgi:DNA polymerase-3 subunit gamma/tau